MAEETKQELPVVTPAPHKQQEIPANVAEQNFSVEDFEVEQLPEQEAKEQPPAEKVEKQPTKKVEKVPEKVEEKAEEDTKEEGVEDEQEPEKKLPKFLKPPKGAEEKVEEKAEKGKVKPIVPPAKQARDFTGFSKAEADAGRQMSNEAFSIYQDAIKKRNELNSVAEKQYMQHPQAYVLDSGFQETRTKLTYAQREQAYWEEQLVNMSENGTDLVPILGFDPKTGQPILDKPIPATKALEERVRQCIYNCNGATRELQGKLAEYPAKYQSNIQQDLKGVEEYRKQQFGWNNDPKLLDYSLPIEGIGDRTLKQIREDVSAMVPAWARSHPLTPLLGDVVIALRIAQAEVAELKATTNNKQVQQEEAELVEPKGGRSSNARSKGDKVHGISEFVIDPSLGI